MNSGLPIPTAIRDLLEVVRGLRDAHPGKRFTLDGRLVGDIGEVLVAEAYDVELMEGMPKHHDGKTPDGRLVQIKATMQKALTFPVDHTPDYYLGIIIYEDGLFSEVFNGPGEIARRAIEYRKPSKTNLHSVSVGALLKHNGDEVVPLEERIPLRAGASVRPVPLRPQAPGRSRA